MSSSLLYVSTGSGRSQKVADMPTQHLRNAIAKMGREVPSEYLANMPVYAAMKAELEERTQPRIVQADGTGMYGTYRSQWRVIGGKLQTRNMPLRPTQYGRTRGWTEWRPATTLTREVLEQLLNLYESPTESR